MTRPTRPGNGHRCYVTSEAAASGLDCNRPPCAGRSYRGAFSFWTNPTDAITRALQTAAPDSYADRIAAKQDRAAARADRHTEWAEKADTRSESAYRGARASVAGIEPGQPILVGHHSERRHRAALRRHDARMHRAIEEQQTAEYHRSRSAAAERTASNDHSAGFCQRRIAEAEAAIRDYDRRLARDGDDAYRVQLERAKADANEKRTYWIARLAAAGGISFTRDTIQPGDEARPRSHPWATVAHCNATTVSVRWETGLLAGMTGKYPYAEITDYRRKGDADA